MRDAVRERLDLLVADGFCEFVSDEFVVEETASDGAARLVCTLPAGARALRFDTSKLRFPSRFQFLRKMVSCDGVALVERAPAVWEAHVFECKKTMSTDRWAHAKEQLGWSLVRLDAFAGVVGITLAAAVCHTAFRETRLHLVRETADPALLRVPLGESSVAREGNALLLGPNLDWDDATPELPPLFRATTHVKHRLDPGDGSGRCNL